MTTLGAIRSAILGDLKSLLERPGMWARSGGEVELLLWQAMRQLEVIDGSTNHQFRQLRDRHGKLGLTGPFRAAFGEEMTYRAEIVSIAAQASAAAAYVSFPECARADSWEDFVSRVGEQVKDADLRRREILGLYGPPSFSVAIGDGPYDAMVDGYMRPDDPSVWVFFDYWQETDRSWYRPAGTTSARQGFAEDGWLRDVRLPALNWSDGFILTAFGEHLRWGPGWRLNHARNGDDAFPGGIAEQLRAINENDPSQRSARPES